MHKFKHISQGQRKHQSSIKKKHTLNLILMLQLTMCTCSSKNNKSNYLTDLENVWWFKGHEVSEELDQKGEGLLGRRWGSTTVAKHLLKPTYQQRETIYR
jgi:hypothetical protein